MADVNGWLIEAPWENGSPSYLYVRVESSECCFAWTPPWNSHNEHANALRFARKMDAERFVRALYRAMPQLFLGPNTAPMPRICEHAWSDPNG